MNRRSLFVGSGALLGASAFGQTQQTDPALAESVEKVFKLVQKIQIGSRRESLNEDWIPDGGIQIRWATRFKLRICENIKINVAFKKHGDDWNLNNPEDVIAEISRAYLEHPAYD